MTTNFLPNNPAIKIDRTPKPTPKREPVKLLIIGSSSGVTHTIKTLHRLGFSPVGDWSPLQPTSNPGEVMSILVRQLLTHDREI